MKAQSAQYIDILSHIIISAVQGIASSPGHSKILSHSRGEKLGEGLGSKLRHGLEMVDLVST